MICLGIESTAHTFGIGIMNAKGKVLANVIKQFNTESGGIIPNQLAEHHIANCEIAIDEALRIARIKFEDIDLISFSQGPGIGHALRIGAVCARALSLLNTIPLVGVNHCISHLEIGRILTPAKDPILLYVSGANTQIIAFQSGKYRVFGETLDIGVGNMLDVFAREIGLGFPGGPKIMELARKSRKFIEIPYVIKGMDVSFGGILTNLIDKHKRGAKAEDLCFSLQETVFAMLTEAAERALAFTGKKELLLGGGVACNERLQEMCKIMCDERDSKFFVPQRQYLVDNGAMIAWLGIVAFKAGFSTRIDKSQILPYQRTDDIDVIWRKKYK